MPFLSSSSLMYFLACSVPRHLLWRLTGASGSKPWKLESVEFPAGGHTLTKTINSSRYAYGTTLGACCCSCALPMRVFAGTPRSVVLVRYFLPRFRSEDHGVARAPIVEKTIMCAVL